MDGLLDNLEVAGLLINPCGNRLKSVTLMLIRGFNHRARLLSPAQADYPSFAAVQLVIFGSVP